MAAASIFVMNLDKPTYDANTQPMLSHINVGYGSDLTIKEAALTVAEVVGYQGNIEFDSSKPDGTFRKLMGSRRLEKLGWKASIDLRQGLQQAYADYLAMIDRIKLFKAREVRTHCDAEQEKWYFSIIDVIGVLTDSDNPRKYWSVLKTRLKKEGSQLATNCSQLKMQGADGKRYLTDVADTEQLLRLLQSVPSPKAEPLIQWLAAVGYERIEETEDPELAQKRLLQRMDQPGLHDFPLADERTQLGRDSLAEIVGVVFAGEIRLHVQS